MRSIPPECIAAFIVSSDEGLTYRKKMADRTGLEPATSGVTGRHSNQLNYRSVKANSLMVGGTGIEPVTLAL